MSKEKLKLDREELDFIEQKIIMLNKNKPLDKKEPKADYKRFDNKRINKFML